MSMPSNIDPIYFITPIAVMGITFGLVAYWRLKRRFTSAVLIYSFAAYFGAIILKYVIQALTEKSYVEFVHSNPYALGAYFGMQTVVFEVFGAYLVARYAASRGRLLSMDAASYGIGLALWENGVLISVPVLINYAAYYTLLSSPSTNMNVYTLVHTNYPLLFLPPAQALPFIGLSVLERISSIMLHTGWGYLAVLAATSNRKIYLYAALPMGLADFLVPLEGLMGLPIFELSLFIIAALSLTVALILGSKHKKTVVVVNGENSVGNPIGALSLGWINFKRSLSYSRVYVALGIALSLLLALEFTFLTRRAGARLDEVYPLILPLTVVLGSVGGLWLYTGDRRKGVYEYLIAYGIDVSTIFLSIIVATVGLATLVLASSVLIMVAVYLAMGVHTTLGLIEIILLYTLPLSYSSPVFMSMAGMTWSALTTRVTGVNSPVGVAPLLGIAPPLVVIVLSAVAGPSLSGYVAILVSASVVGLTLVMALVADRKMVRERFLSTE